MERATTRYAERRQRRKRRSRPVVPCATLRHSAYVAPRRLRTADYSEDARRRLGAAVSAAREAAGHRWRPSFAKEIGISPRSLTALEIGEPTVGQAALIAVGRGLAGQGWDENTPLAILEGGQVPVAPTGEERDIAAADYRSPDEILRDHFRKLWDASPDRETFFRVVHQELAQLHADRSNPTERDGASGAS